MRPQGKAAAPPAEWRFRPLPWLSERTGADTSTRTVLADALFLAAVVLLSFTPYIASLGLYSDDWAFLAAFEFAPDKSYGQLVAALMPHGLGTRPVQALVLAGLYTLFGTEPLGYHIFNSLVLASAVVLFHLSLRAIGFSRVIAVCVPLVFGLLPHYSTDRMWIAAFQANVSMALYFVSLFADLRFMLREDARRWLWKALGSVALVGSVLAYEVTAPLLVLNMLVLGFLARRRRDAAEPSADRASPAVAEREPARPPRSKSVAYGIAANMALMAGTIVYKWSTTGRADMSGGYIIRVLRIVREGVPVHFGEYGIGLPVRLLQVARSEPDLWAVAVAFLIGAAVAVYLLRMVLGRGADPIRAVRWLVLVLLGVVLFGVGYGVTMTTWEIGFHATGTNNRTAIAAVPGVSCVFVGVIGWLAGLLPSRRAGHFGFAAMVALLVAASTAVLTTVADAWVVAARAQETVIESIREQFPALDRPTTILLDGLCPYVGPAPVFATGWDVTGMLQLVYDRLDVQGDVIKPNSEVTPAGIRTILFDDVINLYPYGDRLHVYHLVTGQVTVLPDQAAARRYVETVSRPQWPACPPYTDGDGMEIF